MHTSRPRVQRLPQTIAAACLFGILLPGIAPAAQAGGIRHGGIGGAILAGLTHFTPPDRDTLGAIGAALVATGFLLRSRATRPKPQTPPGQTPGRSGAAANDDAHWSVGRPAMPESSAD